MLLDITNSRGLAPVAEDADGLFVRAPRPTRRWTTGGSFQRKPAPPPRDPDFSLPGYTALPAPPEVTIEALRGELLDEVAEDAVRAAVATATHVAHDDFSRLLRVV